MVNTYKKNILVGLLAVVLCLSSNSLVALNKKRVARGVGYGALTGVSAMSAVCVAFVTMCEISNNGASKAVADICYGAMVEVPCLYGVYAGVTGLAAVYYDDENQEKIDVDTVVS